MIPTIQGRCRATTLDARGLGDAPFLHAKSTRHLREFLDSLPVAQRSAKTENMILDNFAGMMFFQTWEGSGMPEPEGSWSAGSLTTQGILATVLLSNESSETGYTEKSGTSFTGIHTLSGTVDTSYAGKFFVGGDVDDFDLHTHPDGRESLVFASRFLWLPSEGDLVNIRSVAYWWCENADSTATLRRVMTGRVRLKDSGGNPITMGKTPNQALLVEYEHEFVSN